MFRVRRYLALLLVGSPWMVNACSGDDATGHDIADDPVKDGSSGLGDASHHDGGDASADVSPGESGRQDAGARDAGAGGTDASISDPIADISPDGGNGQDTESDASDGGATDAPSSSDALSHAATSNDASQASPHVIFVTSETYTGDLVGQANTLIGSGIPVPPLGTFQKDQGREAADAICALHAKKASLPGTFRAVLQTGAVNAFTVFHDSDGPWALVDATPVADTVADLEAGNFHTSIERTEAGVLLRSTVVWGKGESDDDCDGWSSATQDKTAIAGTTATVTTSWFSSVRLYCEDNAHLYCLQVGSGGKPNVLPSLPTGAKIAFVAKGPYPGDFAAGTQAIDGGADAVHVAADARCAQAASAASRSGTFHAWISSSTMSAAAYFTSLGMSGPWHRPDGFLVASSLSELTDAHGTSTQMVLMPDGSFAGYQGIWTGTQQDGSASPDNCNDFTSKSSSAYIRAGATSVKGSDWASVLGAACSITYFGLDCFQE